MDCWRWGYGLHFCNPQTEGEVVGGGGGDIFVTRDGVMLLEYGGDAAWVWEGVY